MVWVLSVVDFFSCRSIKWHKRSLPLTAFLFLLESVLKQEQFQKSKAVCAEAPLKKEFVKCMSWVSVICPVLSVSKYTHFLKAQLLESCNFIKVWFLPVYSKFSWITEMERRQKALKLWPKLTSRSKNKQGAPPVGRHVFYW